MKTTSYSPGETGGFAFAPETEARAKTILARYPEDRKASAIIPLLDLAQRDNGGWLSSEAIEYVAAYLDMAPIRAYEVASFYTMFYLQPVGKYLIQVCRTTTCWACGSDEITKTCLDKLGVGMKEVTEDGLFSVMEVECLGACCNAPMVQINDHYYEDLTPGRMAEIIDDLRAGKDVPIGPQCKRMCSEPLGGRPTLLEVPPQQAPSSPGEEA